MVRPADFDSYDIPDDDADFGARIDRLMDAIDLVKANQREEARGILRALIREDSNFEDAWLWMSVAVDSLDQASVCLDNVLRVNPNNGAAASALFRLRHAALQVEKRRGRLRFYRDTTFALLWLLILFLLFSVLVAGVRIQMAAIE